MSGVLFAVTAGITFGLFQAVNRRANADADPYRATFALLAIGTVALAIASALTQDLNLLSSAPLSSFGFFAAAGIVHFFFGWTFLSLSQQQVGASRTGSAVAAAPLVGTVLAALVLGERITVVIGVGVVLVVGGLAVLALRGMGSLESGANHIPWFGLAAAFSWGTSPLFIRWGLEGLPAPLIGVTFGLASAMLAYAIALTLTGRWAAGTIPTANLRWIALAGVLVAVAIAAQWESYDRITIAVAITLIQLATPVVIVTAPWIVGTEMERATIPMVMGTALIMAGSILVVLA